MNIDWSKAPDGATHYGHENSDYHACWYIVEENRLAAMHANSKGASFAWRDIDHEDRNEIIPRLIPRPATWGGEGLPPVGCTVTLSDDGFRVFDAYRAMLGVDVTVVAAFKSPTGFDMIACAIPDGLCGCFRADMARPVKTPEQIAAEEREKELEAMFKIYRDAGEFRAGLSALYDAGYRKQEDKAAERAVIAFREKHGFTRQHGNPRAIVRAAAEIGESME